MAILPLVALGLILLPQSLSDHLRVWAGPVFSPLQDLTQGWALDLAEQIRNPGASAADSAGPPPHEQIKTLENALAEATALLAQYDRQVKQLARLRQDLGNLPCRLTHARLLAPEMPGGQAAARLAEGADKGVRKGGAVVSARLDLGAREALERGDPVLTAAGLVGVVDEVGPVTSTVRLVTDSRTSLMVQVITCRNGQWRAGPEGISRGAENGTTLTVQGIPRDSDVVPGDFVVTSPSREAALPPYLILGRVVRCELKPAALFYTLTVEPRVSPAEAREVYILSPDTDAAPLPTPRASDARPSGASRKH